MSLRLETDRALIPAHVQSSRYLTVTITAPERPRQAEWPPVNVALVLDRSGSMAGRKIELARQAVAHAIRLLDARDRLSLVVFDDQIDVVLESTPASPEAKARALAGLEEIDARGSTNLHGGWTRGAAEILRHFASGTGSAGSQAGMPGTSRVLVLTDGLANVGVVDHDALAGVAAELRAQRVATTTFGLGGDFEEVLLARIAAAGGGRFYFIEDPRQIPDVLTSELGEALEVVAPGAELVVSAGEDVMVSVLNDLPVFRGQGNGGVCVQLGDLVSGQVVDVAVQLAMAPRLESTRARVECQLADRAGALFARPMPVEWMAADREANASQPVNVDVLVAAAKQMSVRISSQALAANRAGDFDKAAELLTRGAEALRAIGDVPAIERLARELERRRDEYAAPLNAIFAKQAFYDLHCLSASREPDGKARRRSKRGELSPR